jgi:hypothetical protein
MILGSLVQYYDHQKGWHCGYLIQVNGKRARIQPTAAKDSLKRVRCKWVQLVDVREIE